MSARAGLATAPGIAAAAALSTLAACGGDAPALRPVRVGDPAPAYAAVSLEGDSVRLSDLDGPVVLNLWATWCQPCREEMPELQELAERYDGRLEVVGVSIDSRGSEPTVRNFLDQLGVGFRILHDPEQRFVSTFRTIGVPETFLIDREGIVRARWTGPFHPLEPENVALFDEVLEAASGA
ncbi:MAG TPA: TlpA disulfide reductase family protein [Longimicrobiales bacterium]|nr:TlpA disulfide reductase family protein [Longimicrobiales bacterium]